MPKTDLQAAIARRKLALKKQKEGFPAEAPAGDPERRRRLKQMQRTRRMLKRAQRARRRERARSAAGKPQETA